MTFWKNFIRLVGFAPISVHRDGEINININLLELKVRFVGT